MEQRYEYGIFNVDKERICAANNVDPTDEEWKFLWSTPIGIEYAEHLAQDRVDEINFERGEDGKLARFGPVGARKRLVSYGDWEEL